VAGLGIVSRLFPVGFILWDKYLGDVVYAAVFYLCLSLIWPRGAIAGKAFWTVVYVVAIETFQLTPIPVQLGHSDNLVIRLFAYVVLGSRFSGWDLLAYGVGLAAIIVVDRFYLTT
jgi:hypothetical protein